MFYYTSEDPSFRTKFQFTPLQRAELQKVFENNSKPSNQFMRKLATEMGVGRKSVMNWFRASRRKKCNNTGTRAKSSKTE